MREGQALKRQKGNCGWKKKKKKISCRQPSSTLKSHHGRGKKSKGEKRSKAEGGKGIGPGGEKPKNFSCQRIGCGDKKLHATRRNEIKWEKGGVCPIKKKLGWETGF